jgi:hypothetical protein
MSRTPPALPARSVFDDGKSLDVAALLHAADVVLVETSTVGMEAALVDRPLVKLCIAAQDSSPYHTMGLALPVFSLADLESTLEQSLTINPATIALRAARQKLPRAGGAASRVVDALERFVNGVSTRGETPSQFRQRRAG